MVRYFHTFVRFSPAKSEAKMNVFMNSLLLDIKNLTISFIQREEETIAAESIEFTLRKGETLGIVGESGSGKSVTALAIMGLLPPDTARISSGEIIFNEENVSAVDLLKLDPKKIRNYRGSKISMVFQEPMTSLNPVMKCGRQLVETLALHEKQTAKDARTKALQLLSEVRIDNPKRVFNAYPHEISGGQKQRVMIAIAMACRPSLLIADEPTTALDVSVQKTILELFRDLQLRHGMGMIFITHDLAVVSDVADKLIVMQKGKIVEQASVAEVFNHPRHPYTQGLIACRPPLDERLKFLPTVDDFINKKEDSAINRQIISIEERKNEHKLLYKQEPVLSIKDLWVRFPQKTNIFGKVLDWKTVVNKISLDVYPGETLGLVGESGCGKTTLGRGILRLVEAASGKIIYKGTELSRLSQRELRMFRKNIQIIFQDPYSSLNPKLTIGEMITEPMQVHNLLDNDSRRKEKAKALLEMVGLEPGLFTRFPHQFSGGQRQRICIARALALEPEFIICDESVSALDISHQAQVLNLLNQLKKDFHFTYIFISHDLAVVKFMSDRIMVMEAGNIVESGEADQLYLNPQTSYARKLIESIPGGLHAHKSG